MFEWLTRLFHLQHVAGPVEAEAVQGSPAVAGGRILVPDSEARSPSAPPSPADAFERWLLAERYDSRRLSPRQRKHLSDAFVALGGELPRAEAERRREISALVSHYEHRLGSKFVGDELGYRAGLTTIAVALGWSVQQTRFELDAATRRT